MYQFIKPVLFKLNPEMAHDLTMSCMAYASRDKIAMNALEKFYGDKTPELATSVMGLDFKHPIGLAAGLDKNARALPAFSALGFSAVELGTVTPKPQPGNDKPRMFRLVEDEAIINRMGFNSGGLDTFLNNIRRERCTAKVGINIGKNAATSIEDAKYDYTSALQRVYSQADYITINISSPNTKSLRDLQNAEYLDSLLFEIKNIQKKCEKVHKKHVPVALKVAPDLQPNEIDTIAELLLSHQFDALIATNTTISRPETLVSAHKEETGGLSGKPLTKLSTDIIEQFYNRLRGRVPIIGVGGINNADDAWEKLLAGADYLQVYSALIYQGPALIKQIVNGLKLKLEATGRDSLQQALSELRQPSD